MAVHRENGRTEEVPIRTRILPALPVTLLMLSLGACSIERMAMDRIVDLLAGEQSEVFTGEEDMDLVGEALPFALKLYESLLDTVDDSPELYLTTGQAFVLYARAFVQMPAEMLPDTEFDARLTGQERAKRLYLRARRYILAGLDLRHPGIAETLLSGKDWEPALARTTLKDADWLYWGGLAWMGAYTTDTFDFELLLSVPRAAGMIGRVLELDESWDDGGVHEFFISYYGSLPPDLGGSEQKARFHYQRALDLSRGAKAGPHVALATTVSVKNQDHEEFVRLVEAALAVDMDEQPRMRLTNAISRRQAAWLLAHLEDYFLIGGEE